MKKSLLFLVKVMLCVIIVNFSSFAEKKVEKSISDPAFKDNVKAAELFKQGNDKYRDGKYGKAIELYKQSLAEVPANYKVEYALGLAYKKTKQTQEAIETFKAVTEHNNDFGRDDSKYDEKAYYQIAAINLKSKNFKTAFEYYEKAAKIDSLEENYLSGMAKTAYFMGNYSKAISIYKQVVSLERIRPKEKGKAYEMLLRSSLDAAQYGNVIKYYKEYPRNTKSKRSTAYYAEALYKQGNKAAALAEFKKLKGKYPGATKWVEKIQKEL